MTTTCLILTLLAVGLCFHLAKSKSLSKDVDTMQKAVGFSPLGDSSLGDSPLSVPEMITKNGYPCQSHIVTTDDGYILTLHRIPHGRKPNNWGNTRTPVFFQHGILSSSASWVLSGPDKSPAYVYADAGYDVWLGNIRGNRYSRTHMTLDPSESQFWAFSWDHMAYYDIPAQIDYVLHQTGYSQLYYTGHSMGTTIFFAGMSMKPEYNQKIKKAYTLAPVGTLGHINTPLRLLSYFTSEILWASYFSGYYEFLPENSYLMDFVRGICNWLSITEYICGNMLFLITGFDNHEFNKDMLPLISQELLSGTSVYTIVHYMQEYRSGKFRRYDHGFNNMDIYNSTTPPLYDLKKVTAPVVLFYGPNDYLADKQDVDFLASTLPNVQDWKVDYKNFNHLDFLLAIDVYKLVYKRLLSDMGHF